MPTKIQIRGKLNYYTKPYIRQWKWRHQVHGAFYEKPLTIPPGLQDKNIEIIDPLHPKPVENPVWRPPRRHPAMEHFFPKPEAKDHPLYHEKPTLLMNKSVKFHAGVDQVCLLTKTMPVYKLSETVTANIGKFTSKNEDTIIQNSIRQALAYNPTKERCPGVHIAKDVKFKIGREYATSDRQQMSIVFDNLIRYCNSQITNNDQALSRKLMQNTSFYTNLQRADDSIHIRRNAEFALYSRNPLNAPANQDEVAKTADYKFIDMYPIFPTVDLLNENIYEDKHNIGWMIDNVNKVNNPFKYVHTVFHINDDTFSAEADMARLIMFAFGYAHAQASLYKEKFETNSNLELKTPVVVNAISMQNEKLNMVTYQLNTLNLKNNSGIKNIVYMDKNSELYLNRPNVNELPYPSRRDIQRYAIRKLDYNRDAFQKFKSLLLSDVVL